MNNEEYKDFEQYGLYPQDFRIDVYRAHMMNGNRSGVEIKIPQLDISVKCHSEKSQIKNRDKCLRYLKLIIEDIMERR